MAFKISTDICINCGACATECPSDAIYEEGGVFAIRSDECIDCGTCTDICPVGAPEQI